MNTQTTVVAESHEIDSLFSGEAFMAAIKRMARKIVEHIKFMEQVRAEREILANMSPHLLSDIGIEVGAAYQESARSLFDLPPVRR